MSKLIKSYRYASKVQCKLREEPEEGLFKAAEKVAYFHSEDGLTEHRNRGKAVSISSTARRKAKARNQTPQILPPNL